MSEPCVVVVALAGRPCRIYADRYLTGGLVLQLWDSEEEYDTLTINVPEVPLAEDEVIANHDIPRERCSDLEKAGVWVCLNSVTYGYAKSWIYRVLSPELLACPPLPPAVLPSGPPRGYRRPDDRMGIPVGEQRFFQWNTTELPAEIPQPVEMRQLVGHGPRKGQVTRSRYRLVWISTVWGWEMEGDADGTEPLLMMFKDDLAIPVGIKPFTGREGE